MIDKIKSWVNKNYWAVIYCLLVMFLARSCRLGHTNRQLEYNNIQHELVVDSMQNIIDKNIYDNKTLCDTLLFVNNENTMLKELIKDVKQDKEYYRKQNRKLTDVAEVLSRKDTIK